MVCWERFEKKWGIGAPKIFSKSVFFNFYSKDLPSRFQTWYTGITI